MSAEYTERVAQYKYIYSFGRLRRHEYREILKKSVPYRVDGERDGSTAVEVLIR